MLFYLVMVLFFKNAFARLEKEKKEKKKKEEGEEE